MGEKQTERPWFVQDAVEMVLATMREVTTSKESTACEKLDSLSQAVLAVTNLLDYL